MEFRAPGRGSSQNYTATNLRLITCHQRQRNIEQLNLSFQKHLEAQIFCKRSPARAEEDLDTRTLNISPYERDG